MGLTFGGGGLVFGRNIELVIRGAIFRGLIFGVAYYVWGFTVCGYFLRLILTLISLETGISNQLFDNFSIYL